MNILYWNFEPSSRISSRVHINSKFPYNILFTFLMDRGRAPNGIGHLMILYAIVTLVQLPTTHLFNQTIQQLYCLVDYLLNCDAICYMNSL